MGDPRKPRKKWEGPYHPWRREVLAEEMKLMGEYGLRNKRELWIAKTYIRRFRHRARKLLSIPPEVRRVEEKSLISRLASLGLLKPDATLDDILDLRVEDILERRLQTVVFRKGLARSIHQARQLIVHGHVAIKGRRIRSPGYLVTLEEEQYVEIAPTSVLKERVVQETAGG